MSVVGRVRVSHEVDSSWNVSPRRSHGVLECDTVVLQNYMLMILSLKRGVICARPWSLIFLAGDKVRTCRKQWHSVEQFKNYMLLFVSTKRWKAEETTLNRYTTA